MNSIRNAYQKMWKSAPSGSSPKAKTARMKEILRLVPFLLKHIKTCDSTTTYKGVSPGKTVSYLKPKKAAQKPILVSKKKCNTYANSHNLLLNMYK